MGCSDIDASECRRKWTSSFGDAVRSALPTPEVKAILKRKRADALDANSRGDTVYGTPGRARALGTGGMLPDFGSPIQASPASVRSVESTASVFEEGERGVTFRGEGYRRYLDNNFSQRRR